MENIEERIAGIDARIALARPKLKTPPADWLAENTLPFLVYANGKPLSQETVRYLLYRQSREKEIRPDAEAKALYALIDRTRSAAFAHAILERFAASKADVTDRWALTVALRAG